MDLTDERLEGCLFDRVEETETALFFGTERKTDAWISSIMKVSKQTGTIEWFYDSEPTLDINSFVINETGSVFCVGDTASKENDQTRWQAVLLVISSEGQLIQENTYSQYGLSSLYSICIWTDGITVAGVSDSGVMVLQLDDDGNPCNAISLDYKEKVSSVFIRAIDEERLLLVATLNNSATDDAVTTQMQYSVLAQDDFTMAK